MADRLTQLQEAVNQVHDLFNCLRKPNANVPIPTEPVTTLFTTFSLCNRYMRGARVKISGTHLIGNNGAMTVI